MAGDVFTPLAVNQGLSIEELKNIIQQRALYIWGAGLTGRGVKRILEKNGFTVKAFLDINPALITVESLAVLRPAAVIPNIKKEGAVLICTVMNQSKAMEQQCLEAGLENGKDFLSYMQIPRRQPVIEVGGACNYVCTVCAKQNSSDKNWNCPEAVGGASDQAHYMNAALYKKVLDKLIADEPLLLSVDISLWREPLENPDIGEIIKITNERVYCKLITKLQNCVYLEDAVKANPACIQVIAEGHEKTYEENQTGGGSWRTFLANLYKLKEYKERYKTNTEIHLLYVMYKNNKSDFYTMKNLCGALGFKIVVDTAYLTPYDNFLDLCGRRELSPQIQKIKELLPWNIEAVLKMCVENARNSCICQRIFPIINYDASVSLCHLFCKPKLIESFLDTPYSKIVEARGSSAFCRVCQRYGLHRLDLEILKKYFPEESMI
jgi:hypothetical protein